MFQKRVVSNVWAVHKEEKLSLEFEFAAAVESADTVVFDREYAALDTAIAGHVERIDL